MGYRISGHESFPCRYSWLPKAVRGLAAKGIVRVKPLLGGIDAWRERNYPMEPRVVGVASPVRN